MEKSDEEIIKEVKEAEPTEEEVKEILKEQYKRIIKVLKKYCDLKEEHYNLISLWVIGTYFHKEFLTFPYLFFNAMKGSGKTRLLKLIASLSRHGELISTPSESVLFREASKCTFCIDECEKITSKERAALRELLNMAYKRGSKTKRSYKWKGETREGYETESFELYCPIAMANIWGLEEVLTDRCITLILERSNKPYFTKKVEIFDLDPDIQIIKRTFSPFHATIDTPLIKNNSSIHVMWNENVENIYSVNSGKHTVVANDVIVVLFNKIIKSELEGRYLELFFPLFLIAENCGVIDETIIFANKITREKKEEDMVESRDISLLVMISNEEKTKEFFHIRELTQKFRELNEDAEWITPDWVGRALRRMGIVTEKIRDSKGRAVRIDFEKLILKIKIFKPIEEPCLIKQPNLKKKCPSCGFEVYEEDWNEIKQTCGFCNPFKKWALSIDG